MAWNSTDWKAAGAGVLDIIKLYPIAFAAMAGAVFGAAITAIIC